MCDKASSTALVLAEIIPNLAELHAVHGAASHAMRMITPSPQSGPCAAKSDEVQHRQGRVRLLLVQLTCFENAPWFFWHVLYRIFSLPYMGVLQKVGVVSRGFFFLAMQSMER